MTESTILLPDPELEMRFSDPTIDAISGFDRFEDLENEAISRIAVRVVFAAIPEIAWIDA